MNPNEQPAERAKAKNILVITGVLVFVLMWATVACFRTAHRQLASLTRVAGPLRAAALGRTTGKYPHSYLAFSLGNHPQTFRIDYSSTVPLDSLLHTVQQQQRAQPGTALVIYYDPPTQWWADATYFQVCQLELPYEVVYSIDEVRQQALGQAALALLALFISAMIGFSQYLAHRDSAETTS